MAAGISEAPPFAIGDVAGQRYRIDTLIGEDALGWVYEVSEINPTVSSEQLSAPLSLRLLRLRFCADEVILTAEAQKAWQNQLSRLRHLRHPGTVPVHEICLGDSEGRVYTVRPAVELLGQSLAAVLAKRAGGLPEPEAVRLCASIAEAVEAAHQAGVLHLALSPQRIFLVQSGDATLVKVADFALLPPMLSPLLGEPGYLSPEQAEGQPCDRRTDQFSLAVIFYEMLSGQPAFIGAPDEDRQTILRRVVSEDPLPLALARPIELALARALSRSRAVRFPGLSDFVCALGVDGVAWTAVRPPGPVRSQLSPQPRPRLPSRVRVPLLIGAFTAVGVLCIYFLMAPGRREPPQPAAAPAMAASAAKPSPPPSSPAPPPDLQPSSQPASPPDARPVELASAVAAGPALPAPAPAKPVSPKPVPPTAVPTAAPTASGPPHGPGPGVAAATATGTLASTGTEIQVSTSGPPLSKHHIDRIKHCLGLIRARPPFSAVLEPFKGTLYVSERTTSAEIRSSNDFRNCLKNEIQGNIEAKDVFIKGISRGRTPP